jgi:hypothetical protein
MTDRNVLDAMPRALPCSNISQCDYPPSQKFKASYLFERASDGGLRNPLCALPGNKMEGLGDVNVQSAQTLTRESRINHSVEPNIR